MAYARGSSVKIFQSSGKSTGASTVPFANCMKTGERIVRGTHRTVNRSIAAGCASLRKTLQNFFGEKFFARFFCNGPRRDSEGANGRSALCVWLCLFESKVGPPNPPFSPSVVSIVDLAASWFIFLCFGFRYWFFYRTASLELSCWNV